MGAIGEGVRAGCIAGTIVGCLGPLIQYGCAVVVLLGLVLLVAMC